jgi:cysteine sulfinate desulfinase/cysteine desulfurase-like protein
MGLTPDQAHCSVRFSLGHMTTEEDIDYCLEGLRQALDETGSSVRFVPCR